MTYFLVILLVSIGFAVLLHRMAEHRHQNPVVWAALGFAFGPLAIPFLYLIRKRKPENEL